MPQTATLTERIVQIPKAVWERRGALAQVAFDVAKCYAAWKLYEIFPDKPTNDHLANAINIANPAYIPLGLSYFYLMGTGIADGVHAAARVMSNYHADVFLPMERGIYLMLTGQRIGDTTPKVKNKK